MLLIATFANAFLLTRRAGETMELLLSAFSQSASGRLLGDAHVVISKFVQRRRCSVSVLPAGLGLFPGSKLRFSSASERFSVRSCVSIRPKSAPNLNIATQKWSWKVLNGQEPLRYRQRLDGGEKRRKEFFFRNQEKKTMAAMVDSKQLLQTPNAVSLWFSSQRWRRSHENDGKLQLHDVQMFEMFLLIWQKQALESRLVLGFALESQSDLRH